MQHLFYSMDTLPQLMYANLQISSKKWSAASWQFFICEILMTILRSLALYLTRDSRVLSFCSAFRGERTVTTISSKQGITNPESNCIGRTKLAMAQANQKWDIAIDKEVDVTHFFQAVLLAQSSKHGPMDLKFAKLQVAVEEFDEIDLREWVERIVVATKLDLHHKLLHLAGALQHRGDGCPGPLDTAHLELLQL
jgi:hypothetical protein